MFRKIVMSDITLKSIYKMLQSQYIHNILYIPFLFHYNILKFYVFYNSCQTEKLSNLSIWLVWFLF